jgi:DtxR family Mn-dependent transcriptional regulator
MTSDATARHSAAVEDYIKHIWKLQSSGRRATTKALADRLDLGRGTVTGMLQQLAGRSLVEYEPYHGVRLTAAGEQLALRQVRRHRLIELFLHQTLGIGWEQVHRDAEQLEHAVSDELIERIDAFLGHPDADPHGAPIPTAAGDLVAQDFQPLVDLEAGDTATLRRVSDHDPEFLTYLNDVGLELGDPIEIIAVDRFGTMHIQIAGKREAHLAREAAQRIHVAVD